MESPLGFYDRFMPAQLIMHNVGEELTEYELTLDQFLFPWIEFTLFMHYFSIVGLLHIDLKAGNILYDSTTNSFVMIDFGLSDSKNDILELDVESTSGCIFFPNYYNDNFSVFNYIFEFLFIPDRKLSDEDLIKKIDEYFIKDRSGLVKYPMYKKMENAKFSDEEFKDYINKIKESAIRYNHMSIDELENLRRKYISTFDSYGYGITLLHLLRLRSIPDDVLEKMKKILMEDILNPSIEEIKTFKEIYVKIGTACSDKLTESQRVIFEESSAIINSDEIVGGKYINYL